MTRTQLQITQNISGRDLKLLYSKEKDPKVKERLLMIIHTKESRTSREIGNALKKSFKTVTIWINRFNEEGIESLKNKPKSGKPPRMEKEQFKTLESDLGKSPKEFGYKQTFWNTKLIRIHILQHYITSYSDRHVQRLMHNFGYSLIKPRPRHFKRDPSQKEEFADNLKKTSRAWVRMDSGNRR